MKTIFLLITYLATVSCNNTQTMSSHGKSIVESKDFYENCRKIVLSEQNIGKEYSFKRVGKEIDELSVFYLGSIVTTKGDTLKILNSTNYTGLYEDSRRANASVILYKSDGVKLGYYNVGNVLSLPKQIIGNNLIFKYNNEQCNQTTSINFEEGIPQNIFVNCTEKGGDQYNFETD